MQSARIASVNRFEGRADDTGKRGAVRNNSGQPVDHSGPDLGVGPTNSETSGRNPEACPPSSQSVETDGKGDTDGSDSSRREALDSSQGKSGWGAGGEAPRASARAELRSEAQQRTSLDSKEINRYTRDLAELHKQGRKRYCGMRTLKGEAANSVTRFIRLDCKTWGCAYCAPKKAKRYKAAIREIAEREQLNRFLTLTLDPRKIEGSPVRYLRRVFNKFRVYLLRKHGQSIKYIAVLEFHKNGNPHLHILLDRFIKHTVDIREVERSGRRQDCRYQIRRYSSHLAVSLKVSDEGASALCASQVPTGNNFSRNSSIGEKSQ